jgi:pimeloyl-ACP methyl ester carboxylesterase
MPGAPVLLSDATKVKDQDRALILVHGLFGSPTDSFADWAKIIAGDSTSLPDHGALSDLAIYAVDYQADFNTHTKLDDVAKGVADDLAGSQIFKLHRHVWFIAHSMGGLVLKRTLILWNEQGKAALTGRVMGVGLLGVPSAGSPLADLAQKYGAEGLATTYGWDGDLLKDLTTDGGSYLDSLETDWMAFKSQRDGATPRRFTPVIWCGFETKPQLGSWIKLLSAQREIELVVPKLFASTACDYVRGLPAKHTDLIKPHAATDSVHIWLVSLLQTSIVAGMKEPRDDLETGPPASGQDGVVPHNVAFRADFQNKDLNPTNFDQSGLPKEPERIEFADAVSAERAKKLVLRSGPFIGSTKLEAWRAAAAENGCLHLSFSSNRLILTLKITDDLHQCPPSEATVCKNQSC